MKSQKLNKAFNHVYEQYLEIAEEECLTKNVNHRRKKHIAAIALAACLIMALSATAFAVGVSIYKSQQEKLSESLRIEENQVHGYVEADIDPAPEEIKPGIQFISSLSDGEFQRVYLSLNPVSAEEARKLILEKSLEDGYLLRCILSNDIIPDEAFNTISNEKWVSPNVRAVYFSDEQEAEHMVEYPDSVTGESFEILDGEYRKQKSYEDSYDEETQTLLIEFSVPLKENIDWTKPVNIRIKMLESKSVMVDDIHSFNYEEYKKSCKPKYIKDFGAGVINVGEAEMVAAQIKEPVLIKNAPGECSIISASVSALGAEFKLHISGGNEIFNSDDLKSENFEKQILWVNYLDGLMQNSEIVFNDGSRIKLSASNSVKCENDVITLFSSWDSTINIRTSESIIINGITLPLA